MVIIVLMAILAVRLFMVTILQHDRWSMEAVDQNTKTIFESAPRGNIYDRNGNVLAENKQVFAVTFNVSSMTTEEINAEIQAKREKAYKDRSDSLYMAWQKYLALGGLVKAEEAKALWLSEVEKINLEFPYKL